MVGETIQGFWTLPFKNQQGHAFKRPAVFVNWESGLNGAAVTSVAQAAVSSSLIGMLDTGADLCRIDERLSIGQTSTRTMNDSLAGIASQSQMFEGKISTQGSDFSISGAFSAQPFRSSGSEYDILLGGDFLQHFDLHIDAYCGAIRMTQRM